MNQQFYSQPTNTLYDAMSDSVKKIGIIQTNLANVNTVAFKSANPDSVLFSEVMSDVFRDESQGVLVRTNNKLDLALTQEGAYFLVEDGEGRAVRTRDGQFFFDKDGTMVDHQGREVVILDKQIDSLAYQEMYKADKIVFDKNGEITVDGDYVGRLAIEYESKMPGQRAYVLQGKLEAANVDLSANIMKVMQVKRHIDTIQGMLSMELGVDKALVETYGRNI